MKASFIFLFLLLLLVNNFVMNFSLEILSGNQKTYNLILTKKYFGWCLFHHYQLSYLDIVGNIFLENFILFLTVKYTDHSRFFISLKPNKVLLIDFLLIESAYHLHITCLYNAVKLFPLRTVWYYIASWTEGDLLG